MEKINAAEIGPYLEEKYRTINKVSRNLLILAERDMSRDEQVEYLKVCIEALMGVSYDEYYKKEHWILDFHDGAID